jgi:spore germination cell wall hydrolase CwlJ-like protein
MTLNFFSGMSIVRAILLALTFIVVEGAAAAPFNKGTMPLTDWFEEQLHIHESWEQKVRRLMRSNLEEHGGTKNALSDRQVKCLAENVYYESRGESLKGQVAVAKVTLNRLDEGYAKTVCGVVKQGCQFSWTCLPGRRYPSGQHWQQAVGVALVTLNNKEQVEDPTNGATHFHATYINWQPTWRRVKDSVNKIGNHVFYRVKPKEEK